MFAIGPDANGREAELRRLPDGHLLLQEVPLDDVAPKTQLPG